MIGLSVQPMQTIAIRAARKAGDLMLRKLENLSDISFKEKSPNDFVSEVDLLSEREILYHLQKAYPDHAILSEEAGLVGNSESDYTWVVDPIDGTTNYLHGLGHFCVSIALKYRHRVELGVIYNPNTDQLFTAIRGNGAQLNDRRIRASSRQKLDGTLIGASPNKPYDSNNYQSLNALHDKVAGFRYSGSLALDLAYVAAGFLDACWCFNAKEWDVAAGSLIAREAGATISELNGGENYLTSGNLIAGNPKLVARVMRELTTSHTVKDEH
ncbi:inositol monophosphatase [Thiotrichales bacterium 19S11-10]|nr:inositol monophosphatase [Thiotrichales bacterium 19S11-10]MCF6808151.1 inositol monophosphatase [Thiotrichales bacterium 19S9-11]MCF6812167.1 inositol monophosphatase [Thiotrichales bacterium 19S9-12]